MSLLDQYVKAVRMYLPRGAEADDIARELAESLQSKMDDRAAELGRPLDDLEQEAVLAHHGNPLIVASRYGTTNHGLAFGRQLIGPELFPRYVRTLAFVAGLVVLIAPFIMLSDRPALTHPLQFVVPMLFNAVVVTVIFIGLDQAKRWSQRRAPELDVRDAWLFPAARLRPTPRWLSAVGIVVFVLVTLWWIAVPSAPVVLGERLATVLEPSGAWARFHGPILALLIASIAHRVVSLTRPDLTWVRPIAMLAINVLGLALLYPILQSAPFVVVRDAASADAVELAREIDNNIWWWTVGFGVYWAINTIVAGSLCARYLVRRNTTRGAA